MSCTARIKIDISKYPSSITWSSDLIYFESSKTYMVELNLKSSQQRKYYVSEAVTCLIMHEVSVFSTKIFDNQTEGVY